MKKLFLIGTLFLSTHVFSQDTSKVQRFSLGIGPSLVVGGWGANTNLSYAVSKKFNVKIRGVVNVGKEVFYQNGTIGTVYAYDISASANYFLFGNTLPSNKANMYIGLGLGYLSQTNKTIEFWPDLLDKEVGQGLAAGLSLGGSVKLGTGRLYAEGYLSIAFLGSFSDKQMFYNPYSYGFKNSTYSNHAGPYGGVLCLNIGYAIPF
ncbi:MAG: hypothetical protein ABI388_06265 [Bacteroidia bacterium]